jgi:hypothetical protein
MTCLYNFTVFIIQKLLETTIDILYCPKLNIIEQPECYISWFLDEETEEH